MEVSDARILRRQLFLLWLHVLASLIGLYLIIQIRSVLVLILIALFFVATFQPLIKWLQKRLSRKAAQTAVVALIIGGIALFFALIIPPMLRQMGGIFENLPKTMEQVQAMLRDVGLNVRINPAPLDLSKRLARLDPETLSYLMLAFGGLASAFTVVILTVYLLIDGPTVATSLIRLLPTPYRLSARRMFGEIGTQIGHYMRAQLITSAMAGVFTYVLLYFTGVPEPLALACLMALADAVPIVGFLVGTIPAVLLAIPQGFGAAAIVLGGYILYHALESYVLVPRIFGKAMKMSSAVVLIAILIGGSLMGILGALLAIPIAAAVPVVWRYVHEWREQEEPAETASAADKPEGETSPGRIPDRPEKGPAARQPLPGQSV
jgi:predicted PurR-regulated permease PerM